jgi:hypothetical protein
LGAITITMKNIISLTGILTIIFLFLCGCEKDDPNAFFVRIILVDEVGKQTSSFKEGDSLIFEFYLTNRTGREAEYKIPCHEFGDYINIYKEDTNGIYNYYGRPIYNCVAVAFYSSINDDESLLLGAIPWCTELGWPERESGKYYVGDTLKLHINNEWHNFTKRIYFEIL